MRAWEKNVRTVVPYVPGEQPNQIGMIKLNTKDVYKRQPVSGMSVYVCPKREVKISR